MFKKILCAVDGSAHADKAVELAADLASRYEAKLYIVHVYMRGLSHDKLNEFADNVHLKDLIAGENVRIDEFVDAIPSSVDMIYIPPPGEETIRRLAEIILEDASSLAGSHGAEDVTTAMLNGKPSDAIITFATDHEADAIVLGSRGLGDVRSLLLGSTSHEVAHLAPCTCITVK